MSSENLNPGAFSHATDLKNRILFTIFLLIIYRLGTYIPLSGIDPEALKEVMSASQKGLFSRVLLSEILFFTVSNLTDSLRTILIFCVFFFNKLSKFSA